jgi:hypothetical protein
MIGVMSILFFGIILGPIAWTMAQNDLRAMAEGHMDPTGESITQSGGACGIFGTIGAAVIIFILIASSH